MNETKVWDQDVQDIADQLVIGVDFEQGVRYVGEMADLVMAARARIAALEEALREIGNIIGGPTMTYAPTVEPKEWAARAEKISARVVEALT